MPTCNHGKWTDCSDQFSEWITDFSQEKDSKDRQLVTSPDQRRWAPQDYLDCNFMNGIRSMAGAGCPQLKNGLSISYYSCKKNMTSTAMYSADSDMLIVP